MNQYLSSWLHISLTGELVNIKLLFGDLDIYNVKTLIFKGSRK